VANRKQTKRELKLQKQAAREQARRAERRRTMITAGIVTTVVIVGLGLVALTIFQENQAVAEEARQAAEAASEAARQASEEAEALANRPVACDAAEPETAADERSTFEEADDVLSDGVDYRAVIETSCGTVVIDLAEQEAPETVNSFVFLAEQGFYDGLEIFRNAASIGALQTGSGTNDPGWQIGYTLPDELQLAEDEGYPAGAVAMANSGPDTGGSQFFFVYNDSFSLDPAYTRFGTVIEGLDVLERIGELETMGAQGESPSQIVYMERVEIREGEGDATASPAPERASPDPGASEDPDASEEE
jgi:cyclophilin family peptidyl-prolyl cis-trans isomerase